MNGSQCVAALFVLSVAPNVLEAQGLMTDAVRPSPFAVAETDPGVSALQFDLEVYARLAADHETGNVVRWTDFEVPGRGTVDLRLVPQEVFERGGTAVVVDADGSERRLAPSVVLFSAFAAGRQSSGFIAMSPDMLHGYLELEGELFILSSGGAGPGAATLASADAFPAGSAAQNWCDVVSGVVPQDTPPPTESGGQAEVRIGDVFLECDNQYRGLFPNDQAAIDYAVVLVGVSSYIFRRDTSIVHRIPNGYLRLWNTTPPWGSGFCITCLRNWWMSSQNPQKDLPRASVHQLTTPVVGGVAMAIGGACTQDLGYEVSSVYGSFPIPPQHTSSDNWDIVVVTHEYGHTWGSPHTFNYSPPIDCNDGSGPDNGTLMSYCHQNPGGIANMGLRFHERVQERVRSHIEPLSCFQVVPIVPGDFDYDGVLSGADVAELENYLTQGFYSSGSEEAFDMNGDGVVADCDLRLLNNTVFGVGYLYCYAEQGCPCGNVGDPCENCVNSTGRGANMLGAGSDSVANDDLVLTAEGLPAGGLGIFLMGSQVPDIPFYDGNLCVGITIQRFPPQVANASGQMTLGPGIAAYANANFPPYAHIGPGSWWDFQVWYRDLNGPCGSGANLSSAVGVVFTP